MKYLFLLVLGLVAGVGATLYFDRDTQYRSVIDRVIDQFSPAPVKLDPVFDRLPQHVLHDFSVEPCFVRDEAFNETPPVWSTRQPIGPISSMKEPGREPPDLSDLPGLVKMEQILSSSGGQRHHCAATRVAEHWFMTAAHCVRMKGPSAVVLDMMLVAPRPDVMQEDTPLLPIDGAVCHAAWYSATGKFDDDIALLHVSDVSRISEVEIATMDSGAAPLEAEAYDHAFFAGWGKNGENRFLQGGSLMIDQIGETFILGNNQGGFSPCVGDSGGPLYVSTTGRPRMVGVLSSVTRDGCPPYDLAFYTRVKTFEHWARNAMKLCRQNGEFVCKESELL